MTHEDLRVIRLIDEASKRRLSRRDIIKRGLTAGLSFSAIGLVLEACGSNSASTKTTSASASTASSGGSAKQSTTPSSASTTANVSTSSSPAASGVETSSGTPVNGGDFTVVFPSSSADLDPQSAYDNQASCVFFGAYEMLLRLKGNSTFEYEPMLAKSWKSDGAGNVSFTLYDNVKFHDGTKCDANAVVQSFQRFYKMQRGPYNDIVRFVADPDKDIVAVDPVTVQFKLRDPGLYSIFLADMASEYGPFVVSPTAVQQNKTKADPWAHNWFVNHMVGTGPYKAVTVNPQQEIVLERFPDYYRGWNGPHFDRIIFRVVEDDSTRLSLIEGGSVDAITNSLTPEDLTKLAKNPSVQIVYYPSTAVYWTGFNCGDRLSDPTVRQGLSYAFPYDQVRQGVYGGLVKRNGGPVTPTTRGYDPKVFIYDTDLQKAKQMISSKIASGTKFTAMFSSGVAQYQEIAQLYQANLQQIGYNMQIQMVERAALENMEYGDSPASQRPDITIINGWWPDYNDAYNQIYPNFASASIGSAGSNWGYYKNTRLDQILSTVEPGVSTADYNKLISEAQNILTQQDPPGAWWGMMGWYNVLRSNIRNFVWNPIYLNSLYFYDMYRVK